MHWASSLTTDTMVSVVKELAQCIREQSTQIAQLVTNQQAMQEQLASMGSGDRMAALERDIREVRTMVLGLQARLD